MRFRMSVALVADMVLNLQHSLTLIYVIHPLTSDVSPSNIRYTAPLQGTHCTRKTGKMAKKNPCQGKHREFRNFAPKKRENTGNLVAQVVNSLVLKVQDISKFAAKISRTILKLDKSAKSVSCM